MVEYTGPMCARIGQALLSKATCSYVPALVPAIFLQATTYQQQQAVLQQKQQADAASARLAEVQQDACQDAWIVCVLLEIMGSSLVTPSHCTAVRVPPPPADAASNAASPQLPTGPRHLQGEVHGEDVLCSWDRGYCFSAGDSVAGSCAEPQSPSYSGRAAGAGAGCSSSSTGSGWTDSCAGAGVLDLLNHCISYPQFVEVLLCLMAARSVSILEPDVKQIRGLSFDEEMQVCRTAVALCPKCTCSDCLFRAAR